MFITIMIKVCPSVGQKKPVYVVLQLSSFEGCHGLSTSHLSENSVDMSVYCFDVRNVLSIFISSKGQNKQVPVLFVGPPELPVICAQSCEIIVQCKMVSKFNLEWTSLSFLVENIKFFSFMGEF